MRLDDLKPVTDALEASKHDVAVAAQEEREAQSALVAERAERSEDDDGGERRNALLVRWQAAAHTLAVALQNLDRAQRSSAATRRDHGRHRST